MGVYLEVHGHTFDGEGFTKEVLRMDFHPNAELNLPPQGHAEICKAKFESLGYTVNGPLED